MSEIAEKPRKPRGQSNLVKNVTSNWVGLISRILLSFFLAPFVVSRLGNVYYGIWTLLNEFTGYLWLFDFGVRESVIKYVAQYHATGDDKELNSTVNAALFLYSAIALLTLLGTGAMVFALPYIFSIPDASVSEARWALFLTGAAIAQGFVANVFVGVMMGLQQFYIVTRVGVLFSFLRAGLIVLALSNGMGIIALAAIQLLMSTLGSTRVYFLARAQLPSYRPSVVVPAREQLQRVFAYSKYVLGNNIGEKVVFRTDAFVIGIFLPITTLTYYAIAGSLVGYLRSMVMTMAAVLNPVSSALEARQDSARLNALFLAACRAAVLIGAPFCVAFYLLGYRFISLWMGPEYAPQATAVLRVLCTAYLMGLPHYCISSVLYGVGKHDIMARWRGVEAAINIVLSVILVNYIGLIGVAIGTLVSHVFVTALVLPLKITRVLGLGLWAYYEAVYVRPLLSAVPFAVVCYLIEVYLRPGSLVTFFVYVGLGLAFYVVPAWFIALGPQDRGLVRSRLGSLLPRRLAGIALARSGSR
jgi:O-antigen/teichoic acid export membrane protein